MKKNSVKVKCVGCGLKKELSPIPHEMPMCMCGMPVVVVKVKV